MFYLFLTQGDLLSQKGDLTHPYILFIISCEHLNQILELIKGS